MSTQTDRIRGALKQAEKIIGKQPGLTSSALAALDRIQAQRQSNAEPVAWMLKREDPLAPSLFTKWDVMRRIELRRNKEEEFIPLYAHPPASTEPRLTVEQAMEVVEPFIDAEAEMEDGARWNWESKHKKYREMIEEIRDRLTKAAKP